ncbi:class I SAM-dependent methyltransferase [Paramicrobacterium chengjingii]|uniref:SAM-dependent methyltransferase n=1 Tax=Paramicrobacterium chengjingii TaxID=2769067 RepID=A0ABX6YKK3_9MICO|nr:class I SAM-dependent methyltransferase [Microbacterium chengjingii]QPZ39190.1 SAM-dependent methyltransferase [Microbacterium chengjingii]
MERADLVSLLTPDGMALLDELAEQGSAGDIVATVTRLRKAGHDPDVVAAALTQSRLRVRGRGKFGEFADRMLFTQAGLEQATRIRAAAMHAGRYLANDLTKVADLGCGIGGDAMAMAAMQISVTAVDADEVTAAIATHNLAPFESAHVLHGSAEDADLSDVSAVFFDPARRTSGHTETTRLSNPDDYSPALDTVFDVARRYPTGIKLGPGFDRDLIPADMEAQWVSVDGSVVELMLWSGALARDGITRAALVLSDDGSPEMTASEDSPDEPVRELGAFLYEPDGAVIRARLIGDLARAVGAGPISDGIAYLTGDSESATPFATCFRIIEQLPLDEKVLRRWVKGNDIGTLEIKKRGVDIDPAAFRKRLNPRGSRSATLILTRVGGRHAALVTERLTDQA